MRHRTHMVFDDYIQANATVFTDARHNTMLGEHDMLALHALGDNATSTAGQKFQIWVQHSNDARNWLFRANGLTTAPSLGDIELTYGTSTGFNHGMWSDACLGSTSSGPLLSFVRLQLTVASGLSLHAKVHATLRGGR